MKEAFAKLDEVTKEVDLKIKEGKTKIMTHQSGKCNTNDYTFKQVDSFVSVYLKKDNIETDHVCQQKIEPRTGNFAKNKINKKRNKLRQRDVEIEPGRRAKNQHSLSLNPQEYLRPSDGRRGMSNEIHQ